MTVSRMSVSEYYKLSALLPPETASFVVSKLMVYQPHLVFQQRKSHRLGYFQVIAGQTRGKISLNLNQRPLDMLITILHEIAHMNVYRQFGKRVLPHGAEWKGVFSGLIHDLIAEVPIAEPDLQVLKIVASRPTASHYGNAALARLLISSETNGGKKLELLSDIAPGATFRLLNGRIYRKGEKIRTRFRCSIQETGVVYLINGSVPVEPLY